MAELKFKIKKCGLVRKINDEKVKGYYGKVITNGKATFDEIARESAKNTTLHPKEASLAAELLLEGVCEKIKQGIIVDLGPLGTLYPAVNSPWKTDPEELSLTEMKPKVNYKASDDISAAVRGASLAWATQKDEEEGTETPADDDDINNGGGDNGGGDDNQGGDTPGGLEP
jgi:hypothetical protein